MPNAFEACVFTFGIVQAGGAGRLLAEMIVEGETESDSWAVDPRRFTDHVDQAYTTAKAIETYSHEYAMHFPQIQWPAGRRLSPLYDRLAAAGAEFGSYGGWERADWFLKMMPTGTLPTAMIASIGLTLSAQNAGVADMLAILELTGFSRFHLTGEGTADWLASLITGNLPQVGRIGLVYFASAKGKVLTEMSATRLAEDDFY